MNQVSQLVYEVRVEWKGKEASFLVQAEDYAAACEKARRECRKYTKLPMSGIQTVRYLWPA